MSLLSLSLRDPAGELFNFNGRLLRAVKSIYLENLDSALNSPLVARFVQERRFIPTWNPENVTGLPITLASGDRLVEHPRIAFPSYAHEWGALQLYDAAHLTLDIAEGLLAEGLGLKDASVHNILFLGAEPIFVDVLSVEKRIPGDVLWLPYAQFIRNFLIPLAAHKYFGVSPKQIFLGSREGMSPEELLKLCGPLRRFLSPFFSLATLPTLLSKISLPVPSKQTPEKAQFILKALFRSLRRKLVRLNPGSGKKSHWSNYMESLPSYSAGEWEEKNRFVKRILDQQRPKSVLDVGCNTGHFSELAAHAGARVVALDTDSISVDCTYQRAKQSTLNILPLLQDIAFPSPALGWRNRESAAFLDRSHQAFDLVLGLAVIHHLLLSAGIPLPEILRLLFVVSSDYVLLEWVEPSDALFKKLARGRDFSFLTKEYFEETTAESFETVEKITLAGSSRHLYYLKKKRETL
jgi:SAM-dependent methyltransferase